MQNSLPCLPGIYRWVLCLRLQFVKSQLRKKNLTKKIVFFFMLSSFLWDRVKPTLSSHHEHLLMYCFHFDRASEMAYLSLLGSSSSFSIGHCLFTEVDWPRLHCCVFLSPLKYICISGSNFNPSKSHTTSIPRQPSNWNSYFNFKNL